MDEQGELDTAPGGAVRLMIQCWDPDPAARPSGFDEIEKRLEKMVTAMAKDAGNGKHSAGHELVSEEDIEHTTNPMLVNDNNGSDPEFMGDNPMHHNEHSFESDAIAHENSLAAVYTEIEANFTNGNPMQQSSSL
jgi:hypothetical protein